MANDFEPAERGLRDHLALWRRRAAIILGTTALAVLAAVVLTLTGTKTYQATAQVVFPAEPARQAGPDAAQARFDPNRVIQTEAVFAAGDQVRSQVEAKIGSGGSVTARGLKDSDIIQITATAADPQRAALLANTAAAVYVDLRQAPNGGGGVQVVDPATAPSAAANGSMARNLALAVAVGLVLGLVAAYTVDHLDDAVRDADGLERMTGLPVLGVVADAPTTVHPVPVDDARVARADADRLLRGVAGIATGDGAQVLLVPAGARSRDVRDAVEVLQGVGVHVAAAVLVTPAPGAGAPAGDASAAVGAPEAGAPAGSTAAAGGRPAGTAPPARAATWSPRPHRRACRRPRAPNRTQGRRRRRASSDPAAPRAVTAPHRRPTPRSRPAGRDQRACGRAGTG